jgi:translocation and assembly module TamA
VKERYHYLFFPLQAIYDSSNNRLNPVRGQQLFGRTSFFEEIGGGQSFLKSQFEGRHYHMLWERYRLSSGLRLMLGSIDGAALDAVPADERFYAGGGGSVRGYEYQAVGPQVDGVAVGGDKLLEFSTELRLQPGKRIGYVAFVDGGTVYNEQEDAYSRSLRYGAGLGVRWFTTIGPLRADFAYPLNPDSEQVERLQFYISLGQAF